MGGPPVPIPLDTHPLVLSYNEDLAREAGLMEGDQIKLLIGGDVSSRAPWRPPARQSGAIRSAARCRPVCA